MPTDLTQPEREKLARLAGWSRGITKEIYVDGFGRRTGGSREFETWFRSGEDGYIQLSFVPHLTLDELFELAGNSLGEFHILGLPDTNRVVWDGDNVDGPDLRTALSKAILAAKGGDDGG